MKKIASLVMVSVFFLGASGFERTYAAPVDSKSEMGIKKKKKYKGFKKPKSKKILGIFKRKSDCGCPNH